MQQHSIYVISLVVEYRKPRMVRTLSSFRLAAWTLYILRPMQDDHMSHGIYVSTSLLLLSEMAAPLVGRRVIVSGITGRAELNNRVGIAESFNDSNSELQH